MEERNGDTVIEAKQLLDALAAYRQRLRNQGHPAKAAVVEQCIDIVRRQAGPARTTKPGE